MDTEIITVGTELLNGRKQDLHGPWLGGKLAGMGLAPRFIGSVADDAADIEAAMRTALDRSRLVLVCGGLGPTVDDITREVAAKVTGFPLREDAKVKEQLTALFSSKGRTMTPNNLRQAQLPEGAVALRNPRGTAPGIRISCKGGQTLILLPGPPAEMQAVFDAEVLPWLLSQGHQPAAPTRVLHCWGLSESAVDQALRDLLPDGDTRSLALLAHENHVELRLTSGELEHQVLARLGDHVFSTEGEPLARVVGQLLVNRGATLAVAESCTGGRVASALTSEAGSSRYFLAGLVTYAESAKTDLLEVPPYVLKRSGAVSKDTALAMAVGLARRFGADFNLAVTGIAGPEGGSADKPVGLVHFALAGPDGVVTQEFRFGTAPRRELQARATQAALFLIYRVLCGLPVPEQDSDRASLPGH